MIETKLDARSDLVSVSSLALLGQACRLPGADDPEQLWQMLLDGRCSVSGAPTDRWRAERFFHPRRTEPGFSYSFAGGYIDRPFDFDPTVFGISPREAQQIDPQQRLLLEVVWEALEDAGIPPSSVAGESIGVYVGASNVDYQSSVSLDPSAIESHFMTGNSLSIISNRVSYIFDWRGPSCTVDSACSSSFVALAQAMAAIEAGIIDTAVVAGVNLLLSPAPFIGFSRASMLSPTGLCRPFSEKADGYVRSEGAIALVLRRLDTAKANGDRIRAVVTAAGVNSDGRTSGISLPSTDGQRRMLEATYAKLELDPNHLAFVEAHGTGTPVGDPVEARAIGEALAMHRNRPLAIGSIKSNIGHLECVSGLAGLLKTSMSLEHGIYPRTQHLDAFNSNIDFDGLNLAPTRDDYDLLPDNLQFAGICNYGFGGTNAHVVVRKPTADEARGRTDALLSVDQPAKLLVLSARSRESLSALATAYADRLEESDIDLPTLAAATARDRDLLDHRLAAVIGQPDDMVARLRDAAAGKTTGSELVTGRAVSRTAKVAFIYSGNGAQWSGMGRFAFARNKAFRQSLREIDAAFRPHGGWSLIDAMHDSNLQELLRKTSVAQPLLFGVQAALTKAMAENGIVPDMVLGHSVGEVAAAYASGSLSLADAAYLIHHRSLRQEAVAGQGRMVALGLGEEDTAKFLAEFEGSGLAIAAINSPSSVTVSGPEEAIVALTRAAKKRRVAYVALSINYPFHTHLVEIAHEAILSDLANLNPMQNAVPFISSVTGDVCPGPSLDAAYWWKNIRQPVHFTDAVKKAASLGANLFVEVGPRPILVAATIETLRHTDMVADAMATLTDKDDPEGGDPVLGAVARAIVRGASVDSRKAYGSAPQKRVPLPHYPWNRQRFTIPLTSDGYDMFGGAFGNTPTHPLLGRREGQDAPEWRAVIDAHIVPYLADHRVDGETILPASAYVEMALAVGREVIGDEPLQLQDFDILRPLSLPNDSMRELSTRFDKTVSTVEIWSRRRLSEENWVLHARGRLTAAKGSRERARDQYDLAQGTVVNADEVYAAARRAGLDYGDSFRLITTLKRDGKTTFAEMLPPSAPTGLFEDRHMLHPTSLDAAFHVLFLERTQDKGEVRAHLPVRFHTLTLWQPEAVVERAVVRRLRDTDQTKSVNIVLLAKDGSPIAEVRGAVLRAVVLSLHDDDERLYRIDYEPLRQLAHPAFAPAEAEPVAVAPSVPDGWLLLRALTRSLAYETVAGLADGRELSIEDFVHQGLVHEDSAFRAAGLRDYLLDQGFATIDGRLDNSRPHSAPPPTDLIFRTLVQRFPEMNSEIRLASYAIASLGEELRAGPKTEYPAALLTQFEEDGLIFQDMLSAIRDAIHETIQTMAPVRPHIVVPKPWTAGLLRVLLPYALQKSARITLLGSEASARERINARFGANVFEFASPAKMDELDLGPVDLVVALAFSPLLDDVIEQDLSELGLSLSGARILVATVQMDPALDVLLGGKQDWYQHSLGARFPTGLIPSRRASELVLNRLGAHGIEVVPLANGLGTLLHGRIDAKPEIEAKASPKIVLCADGPANDFAAALIADAKALPVTVDALVTSDTVEALLDADRPLQLIFPTSATASPSESELLAGHVLRLKRVLEWAQAKEQPVDLWIVTSGANPAGDTPVDPIATALTAFARVAMNEHPGVTVRSLDVPAWDAPSAARLAEVIQAAPADAEIVITEANVLGAIVQRGRAPAPVEPTETRSLRLTVPQRGALASMVWIAAGRTLPKADEVEVAIVATGLNFRDVMLALGALDDDIIGDGLTESSLGFEFSGVVVKVGADSIHKVGDRVMGFGSHAFGTHVTVPGWCLFKIPDNIATEAAATIPVAFATAWYGLIDCARLKRGETVLIHGAAGGVGLAAVQIALGQGARVIATVGTAEKTAMLKLLGVEAVYNSRSLAFADQIAAEHGGVNVVLNSLAGEAMTASLRLLKPFGRFVELGKRDFLANTTIGVRPFARNLSYFGVDIDQLLEHDPEYIKGMMVQLQTMLAEGSLTPIPYRVFKGEDISDAFRQMQSAGHMGKLVVRPAETGIEKRQDRTFKPGAGVHVIVGGTQGLGFETAMWLLRRGAETVVVASRNGLVDPLLVRRAAEAAIDTRRIVSEQVDAREPASIAAMIERVTAAYGAISGIIHTAMVLDDGLIQGLDEGQLATVFGPKVEGVLALDEATRDQTLDYFVVYSSAAALIGSPGQGAYVAANAYLEGVIQRRRQQGKPGLAVAWGAISDAGVLAKQQQLSQRLQRTTGVTGIPAREALDFLEQLMAAGDSVAPIQVYADIRRGAVADQLAILKTPAFGRVFASNGDDPVANAGDAAALIEGKSDLEALEILTPLLAAEIGKILRLPTEAIDPARSLSDLGMDSLMALELRLSVEKRFGAELPLLAIGNGRTLTDLVKHLVAGLRSTEEPADDVAAATPVRSQADVAMLERHGLEDMDKKELADLVAAVDERRKVVGRLT